MSFSERIRKAIENSKFCYAKDGGQGFVDKKDCTCASDNRCQSFKDQERFYEHFEYLGFGDDFDLKKRNEIVKAIKPEFVDSKWWKDNVKEYDVIEVDIGKVTKGDNN